MGVPLLSATVPETVVCAKSKDGKKMIKNVIIEIFIEWVVYNLDQR